MDEYREPQLAEGLASMASLTTAVDRFSATRFIIPDLNVTAYVCDYFLEEGTHQLIMFLLLFSPCISVVPTTAREFTATDFIYCVFGLSLNIK